jgi:hypothetical protein
MINAAASTRTTSTKTTAKATTSTKKSTATTKSSTKKKKKGGISSGGSIAGLVIGIIVIVVVLLIAGFFFWRKNKAKKNVEGGEMEREGGQDPPKEGHYAGEGGKDREISGDTPKGAHVQEMDVSPHQQYNPPATGYEMGGPGQHPGYEQTRELPANDGHLAASQPGLKTSNSNASMGETIVMAPGEGPAIDPRDMTPAQLKELEEEEERVEEAIKESERLVGLKAQRKALQAKIDLAKGGNGGIS